jgi:hypothetical protein
LGPYLEKYPTQKRNGRVAQVVESLTRSIRHEFKAQYHKKKEKKKD